MSERDFSIGDRKFKLCKIDVFKQYAIARRLAPMIGDIIQVANKLNKMDEAKRKEHELDTFLPIINGMSKMSDVDANMVLLGLCSAVEMQQIHGNWAKVATEAGLMFQDLELPMLLQIAGRAFAYNMRGFFLGSQQSSLGQA